MNGGKIHKNKRFTNISVLQFDITFEGFENQSFLEYDKFSM